MICYRRVPASSEIEGVGCGSETSNDVVLVGNGGTDKRQEAEIAVANVKM